MHECKATYSEMHIFATKQSRYSVCTAYWFLISMKFWRGGARGDWSFAFKNRREFAGVPTCPPFYPSRRSIAPQICTRVTSFARIYARMSIYYTYNSLTEIYTRTHGRQNPWGGRAKRKNGYSGGEGAGMENIISTSVHDIDSWSISVA